MHQHLHYGSDQFLWLKSAQFIPICRLHDDILGNNFAVWKKSSKFSWRGAKISVDRIEMIRKAIWDRDDYVSVRAHNLSTNIGERLALQNVLKYIAAQEASDGKFL